MIPLGPDHRPVVVSLREALGAAIDRRQVAIIRAHLAENERPSDCACGHATCPGEWSGSCPMPADLLPIYEAELRRVRVIPPAVPGPDGVDL